MRQIQNPPVKTFRNAEPSALAFASEITRPCPLPERTTISFRSLAAFKSRHAALVPDRVLSVPICTRKLQIETLFRMDGCVFCRIHFLQHRVWMPTYWIIRSRTHKRPTLIQLLYAQGSMNVYSRMCFAFSRSVFRSHKPETDLNGFVRLSAEPSYHRCKPRLLPTLRMPAMPPFSCLLNFHHFRSQKSRYALIPAGITMLPDLPPARTLFFQIGTICPHFCP